MKNIEFIIITGMSGAGKTEAIRVFEDIGFFCVDNLPPALISKFAELCLQSEGKVDKVALVIDIRGFFNALFEELASLENKNINYRILFLEASNDSLIRRYKETRRRHPLAQEGRILDAIKLEREKLESIRGKSDKIIDTSQLSINDLKKELKANFTKKELNNKLNISIISFGFKYGMPLDSDLMFDVRFLPNPHYVNSLKDLTGNDREVQDYIFKWPITKKFRKKFFDLIEFLVPQYIKEGKTHLSIAIGCTGGKHRSVTFANELSEFLRNKQYHVITEHRDIDKDI
jgi:UPF0042 nucleotide-binding protein